MDDVSCRALGEKIAVQSAQIDGAFHALLTDIRLFDAERAYETMGAVTTAHWLSWRTRLRAATARERVRVALALGELPLLDEAFRLGEVSYSQVRAITRIATPATEEQLLGFSKNATASQLERLCRQFTDAQGMMSTRPPDLERWVRSRPAGPGMVRIVAQLTVDEAAVVMKAIEAAQAAAHEDSRAAPGEGESESAGEADVSAEAPAALNPVGSADAGAEREPPGDSTDAPATDLQVDVGEPDASAEAWALDSTDGDESKDEDRQWDPVLAEKGSTVEGLVSIDDPDEFMEAIAAASARESALDPPLGPLDLIPELRAADEEYARRLARQRIPVTIYEPGVRPPCSVARASADASPGARPGLAHASAETGRAGWPGRAEGLMRVAEAFLARGASARLRPGGERFTVVVHVAPVPGSDGLDDATLEDGTAVPAETLRRIACDAGLVPVLDGPHGETLDVGRKRRTVPPSIRRALERRDRGCAFPGCNNRRFVDAHHAKHWLHGGETKIGNLVSLCSFHHNAVHERRFRVDADGMGGFTFRAPDGTVLPRVPRPARAVDLLPPRPPMPRPHWEGERVDYGWAVDALVSAAQVARCALQEKESQ